MEKDRLSRKLVVLLHADVVGSTSLVQENETLAHERIQDTFWRFSESICSFGGVALEIRGDALVAEFSRASDSVSASLAFQADNTAHNEQLPDGIRPVLRIGIAMGEVVVANSTVTGEGIVLAQQLEQLAEPGRVCIQAAAYETLPKRLPFAYETLGEQQVKGFDEPVRVYVVSMKPGSELPEPEASGQFDAAALELPDKPSIAVLPFSNMSGDPGQEFFGDGITADIITALSKVSDLMVIARNSTFIYKGNSVDVKQVASDQGVHYVLEGSVGKAGNRVRVSVLLIDATTGQHKWAERYDRYLDDIFMVQDDITRKIITELDIQLRAGEQARFWSSSTENLEAWECFRLGRDVMDTNLNDDIPEAMRFLQKAVDLDSEYAAAWTLMAVCHFRVEEDARFSEDERKQALESMKECAERALECDPLDSTAYATLGMYHLTLKQYDEATDCANKSVNIAPNYAMNIAISAVILTKCGHPERAVERIRKAMRLCPIFPSWYLVVLGQASRVLGKIDEAVDSYVKVISRDPAEILRFSEGLRNAGLPE
ncbi:MAG: adenylate/guanylate cyclase domain-containing protein [Gammaproteobacteria bacterium]|nr:adenylate/guanylate cyclase domain-containing protein [Gammaproteobacteria bacterium]